LPSYSGTIFDRIGSRLPAVVGMAILAAGVFILSRLESESSMIHVVMGMMIAGLGTGIFIAPNTSALMGSAPRQRQGVAGGIMATARNVGMVLGVGLAGAILTTAMAHASRAALFKGVSAGFIAAAILGLIGCLSSAVRGNGNIVS